MNKINRKVEYALIALKHMRAKNPGELTSAKEISLVYGAPFDVVSRVLQTLGKRGVLRSEQGAHGGYQISKDLARLSFLDLNEILLGPVAVAKCIHEEADSRPCEIRGKCNIVSPLHSFNRKLVEFYRGLAISEILDPRSAARVATPSLARAAALAADSAAKDLTGDLLDG